MLGLVVIGVTLMMIFTLVKNALMGKQLTSDDLYDGSIELIVPITARSEFYLEPWIQALSAFKHLPGKLKIHILIDGHHPAAIAWGELHQKLPYVELHSFLTRPKDVNPAFWMIEQIAPRVSSSVVIIGDAELVPSEYAFTATAKYVSQKNRAYFVLPQTARRNLFGEAIALINPSLALVSFFGFRKFTRSLSHSLMSIAQGWMGMPLETFQNINFRTPQVTSWKLALARQWDEERKVYALAFGERHLKRYYPEEVKVQIFQQRIYWEELWAAGNKQGFWLYLAALFIWSFPFLFFASRPFWSMASLFLLILYRFFSKIIFQESWGGVILHPFGALVWLGTFLWWAITGVRTKIGPTSRWNQ